MVNPGAFRGMRKEFLMSEKAAYSAAVEGGYAADALAQIQRRYFKRFPIDLPHDEDPSPEALALVDDDAADPEPNTSEPDPERLSLEEFAATMEHVEERRKLLQFRKGQIKRWLAYQHMKDNDLNPKDSGAYNPYHSLMSKLTGKEVTRPRLKTGVNLWRKTHREEIETFLKNRFGDLKGKRDRLAAERDKIARDMFGKLSAEEQRNWKSMALTEHNELLKQYKKDLEQAMKPSRAPEDRQRCIQGLVGFMQPILDMVSDCTGWSFTVIGGGPEPAQKGQLNIISIHSGTTSGDVKMNFGRAERERYKRYIIPIFGSFLRMCYTPDECRSRALPNDEGYIPIADLTENDNVEFFNWEPANFSFPSATSSTACSNSTRNTSSTVSEDSPSANSSATDPTVDGANTGLPRIISAAKPRAKGPKKTSVSTSGPSHSIPPSTRSSAPSSAPSQGPSPTPSQGPSPTPSRAPSPVLSLAPSPRARSPTPPQARSPTPPQARSPTPPRARSPTPPRARSLTPPRARSLTPPRARSPTPAQARSPTPAQARSPTPPRVSSSTLSQDRSSPPATSSGILRHPSLSTAAVPPHKSPEPTSSSLSSLSAPKEGAASESPHAVAASSRRRSSRRSDLNSGLDAGGNGVTATPTVAGAKRNHTISATATEVSGTEDQSRKRRKTGDSASVALPSSSTTVSATDTVQASEDSPNWFKAALLMLNSADLGPEWQELIRKWAAFEVKEEYQEVAKLKSTHRPVSVKDWIQRGRSPNWRPLIRNTSTYGKEYMRWWTALQPAWRISSDGTISFSSTDGDWEPLRRPGINGLLSVMGSLFHWGTALQKNGKSVKNPQWIAAVRDCLNVYTHILQM
ncbi:hypothetical protein BDN70DRAFT_939020 [Pholiota conissans]|uniref:Uncharacterized protein n=1 Tax=Pholiota conissans TaxID=109636 RepID=A0A9P6CM42_9AGAR|nr:hypothetical protein BDN70DRAFT_939020 [Pholiota conissans]